MERGRGVQAALTAQHIIVSVVRHPVYVGWGLRAALSLVSGDHRRCVDWEPLIGVDGDTEQARVSLRRECGGGLLEAKFPLQPSQNHDPCNIPQGAT